MVQLSEEDSFERLAQVEETLKGVQWPVQALGGSTQPSSRISERTLLLILKKQSLLMQIRDRGAALHD